MDEGLSRQVFYKQPVFFSCGKRRLLCKHRQKRSLKSFKGPSTAIKTFVNVAGMIVFCLAFGLLAGQMGEKGKLMVQFFVVLNDIIMKLVNVVMW